MDGDGGSPADALRTKMEMRGLISHALECAAGCVGGSACGEVDRAAALLARALEELGGAAGGVGGVVHEVLGMPELLQAIAAQLDQGDVLAFALTSRSCLAAVRGAGRELRSPVQATVMSSPSRAHWLLPRAEPGLGDFSSTLLCEHACRAGNVGALKTARARGFAFAWPCFEAAAAGGHLELIQWADAQGLTRQLLRVPKKGEGCAPSGRGVVRGHVFVAAASGGSRRVLEWLLAHPDWARGYKLHRVVAEAAAGGGHTALLEWLVTEKACPIDWGVYHRAAYHGHFDTMRWARGHGVPFEPEDPEGLADGTCASAAEAGNLEILQWARGEGCIWNWHTYRRAAENGHLEVMEWAHAQGLAFEDEHDATAAYGKTTVASAAAGGFMEIVRWAVDPERGCPWGITADVVAELGLLSVLQECRSLGCPWREGTCAEAAVGGHLHVLQYLRAEGCPWDEETVQGARQQGHEAVAEWAALNGCPQPEPGW